MSTGTLNLNAEELRSLVEEMVEEKLSTIFHDPEDDLELTDELKRVLANQTNRIKSGERGESLEDVVSRLGLG